MLLTRKGLSFSSKGTTRDAVAAEAMTKDAFFCDAVQKRIDPTGTYVLRRAYISKAQKRFRQVRQLLQVAVVEQDILGLRPETISPLAIAYAPGQRTVAFQSWVDQLLKATLVEVDGGWMRSMIAAAYTKAVKRAMRLTGKPLAPPDATDAVSNLAVLATVELQGIAEAVSQRIMRAATLAYINRWTPERVFQDIDKALQSVGFVRTRAMLGLMAVKAFTEGTLDQFAAAGVTRVGIIPEHIPLVRTTDARATGPGSRSRGSNPGRSTQYAIRSVQRKLEQMQMVNIVTAGDAKVCQQCEDIEDDNPYTINEARSLIPAHPECRCAYVNIDDGPPDDDDWLEEED